MAIFEDLRLQGQRQGLQNVSSRTPPLFISSTGGTENLIANVSVGYAKGMY